MPDVPFARLPRLDRLKVAGKYDLTEEPTVVSGAEEGEGSDAEGEGEGDAEKENTEGGKTKKALKERMKKKMRGRNKSMKRYVTLCVLMRHKVMFFFFVC